MRTAAQGVGFLLGFCLVWAFVQAEESVLPSLPPFVLSTLDGQSIADADLHGPVMMVFVVPGRPACSSVLALLEECLESHPELRVVLVAPEESDELSEMVVSSSINGPVLLDTSLLLASVFKIYQVPTVCLLVNGVLIGYLEWGFSKEDLLHAADKIMTAIEVPPQGAGTDDIPFAEETPPISFLLVPESLLLMFAGAACPHCHYMLPELFEIAHWFPVCIVITEPLADPERFMSDAPQLTVLHDPDWRLSSLFGVNAVPSVLVIGRDGMVAWRYEGYVEGLPVVAAAMMGRHSGHP